jgi:hypothetical protein
MKTNKSPAEMAKDNHKPLQSDHDHSQYDRTYGAGITAKPQTYMHEHDKVKSRLGGKSREISMGPHGAGLVPANPFASLAQEGYLHAHPEKLGPKKLAEFDAATKGKRLPKHVKNLK